MGPQHEGSWHKTGRVLLPSCQMPAIAFHLPLLILSFMFHHVHRMHPNAAADLTEGGWLGAKARDLAVQAVHKSTVPLIGTLCTQEAVIHRSQFGSLRNPECHGRAVFTTTPWNISQPWLPPTLFAALSACFLLPSSHHSLWQ